MIRILLAAAVLCTLGAAPAFAAPAAAQKDQPLDCKNAVDQVNLNVCAWGVFQHEDDRLNQVYGAYRQTLAPDERASLTTAQKAWLTFRDAECHFETLEHFDRLIHAMEYADCLSELTQQRRKRLESLLKTANP